MGVRTQDGSRLLPALGWLSLGLGALPALRPDVVARLTGVHRKRRNLALLRAVGLRELVVAAGLLTRRSPAWAWARVAQDAVDVPLTVYARRGKRGRRRRRSSRTLAVLLALSALDLYAAVRSSRRRSHPTTTAGAGGKENAMTASSAVTINADQDEIARRLTEAEPPLTEAGTRVSYAPAPGDRGTEVRVVLTGRTPPGGALGEKVAAVVGRDPQRQLDDALRRFKQLVETGEVLRSDGSPDGTDAKAQRHQRPAQPAGQAG